MGSFTKNLIFVLLFDVQQDSTKSLLAILEIGNRAAIDGTIRVGAGGSGSKASAVDIRGADNGAWARRSSARRIGFLAGSGLGESDQVLTLVARALIAARRTHD